MCNFSGKLVAWLDRELPENEAAEVDQHVRACAECRRCANEYEEAGRLFDAYCDALTASKVHRRPFPWKVVFAGSAAVAAAVAVLLAFVPASVEPLPLLSPVAAAPPGVALKSGIIPMKKSQRHRTAAPVRDPVRDPTRGEDSAWLASGPPIQIAIPGEAMFPPGAVPEGVSFVADLSVTADGSAERLHLRP